MENCKDFDGSQENMRELPKIRDVWADGICQA